MKACIDIILSDLERLAKPSFKTFIRYYFFPQGTTYRFQVWLRLMQHVKMNRYLKYTIAPFVYLIYRHYEFKYGIHCNSNIKIGKGMCVVHGGAVYLNCEKIGDNFTCFQGVTLGNSRGGVPTVGNNVTIYTNSVITGAIKLEDNCTIGALSFVNKSVKENTTVVGSPAKVLNI